MKGQYQFTWDDSGNVDTDNVVASEAHEHGPRERQASLIQHEEELTQMQAWMSDDQPPLADVPA